MKFAIKHSKSQREKKHSWMGEFKIGEECDDCRTPCFIAFDSEEEAKEYVQSASVAVSDLINKDIPEQAKRLGGEDKERFMEMAKQYYNEMKEMTQSLEIRELPW